MMRDLFTNLPPKIVDGNYATRTAHLWIKGDPALDEQCLDHAREWMETGDCMSWPEERTNLPTVDPLLLFADELRALVVASALAIERSGFFFELFTESLREVEWLALASFYLYSLAEES